jgi:7-cyano-7-deazaguanine reductase
MKKIKSGGYGEREARAGLKDRLPRLETFPNQFRGYEVRIEMPEFTSICPKTGLPDFGTIVLTYVPRDSCVELKSLKNYINGFRNLGIFNENAVNRILDDVVRACRPVRATVVGEFNQRGGIKTVVEARYPRSNQAAGPA